mgnify:CR=1 FL=1
MLCRVKTLDLLLCGDSETDRFFNTVNTIVIVMIVHPAMQRIPRHWMAR